MITMTNYLHGDGVYHDCYEGIKKEEVRLIHEFDNVI